MYEFSPQASRLAVVSTEPATTVAVSSNGDLVFATSNRQVWIHVLLLFFQSSFSIIKVASFRTLEVF